MGNSIYTGVTGLQANQQALEVIGNNLANANTTGYKEQSISFSDLFYQTLSSTGADPIQAGFGVQTGAINGNLNQGSLTPSANELDMAIQGGGFFVAKNPSGENVFSRAGSFTVDQNNYLVDSGSGYDIQRFGTVGDGGAGLQAFQTPGDNRIKVPYGTAIPGLPTSSLTMAGNLNATAAVGTTTTSAMQIYDSQGSIHVLTLTFTKTASNTWSLAGSLPASEGTVNPGTIGNVTFGTDGSFKGPTNGSMTFTINAPNPLPPQTINFNLGTANGFDGLTQFGTPTSATATTQNGYTAGFLTSVQVDKNGTINGVFTNGQIQPLAQLALASFPNSGGLERSGNNYFSPTIQSGDPEIGTPETGSRGTINQRALESSNVDTATELTRLILAQQGFTVNSKVISINSQISQTLTSIIQ